jgi:hypothetical protein
MPLAEEATAEYGSRVVAVLRLPGQVVLLIHPQRMLRAWNRPAGLLHPVRSLTTRACRRSYRKLATAVPEAATQQSRRNESRRGRTRWVGHIRGLRRRRSEDEPTVVHLPGR